MQTALSVRDLFRAQDTGSGSLGPEPGAWEDFTCRPVPLPGSGSEYGSVPAY